MYEKRQMKSCWKVKEMLFGIRCKVSYVGVYIHVQTLLRLCIRPCDTSCHSQRGRVSASLGIIGEKQCNGFLYS